MSSLGGKANRWRRLAPSKLLNFFEACLSGALRRADRHVYRLCCIAAFDGESKDPSHGGEADFVAQLRSAANRNPVDLHLLE